MKKTFELPKEFAEKWIKALESEDYKQVDGLLALREFEKDKNGNEIFEKPIEGATCYCCLGVAAMVSGCNEDQIAGMELLAEDDKFFIGKGVPEILTLDVDDATPSLVTVLTHLNDGTSVSKMAFFKKHFPDLILIERDVNSSNFLQYNFKEIAQFIKLNVEFV